MRFDFCRNILAFANWWNIGRGSNNELSKLSKKKRGIWYVQMQNIYGRLLNSTH